MEGLWNTIMPIVSAALGGGGIISLIIAKKERRAVLRLKEAQADIADANALEKMQSLYSKFMIDYEADRQKLNQKISKMEGEIKKLLQINQEQYDNCAGCPNNKKRK